jgi:hypothetical protein
MENKLKVQDFREVDWQLEYSSGYLGWRNINSDSEIYEHWIYDSDFQKQKQLFEDYQRDFRLLYEFRLDSLPLGQVCDAVILDFLDKKYNK